MERRLDEMQTQQQTTEANLVAKLEAKLEATEAKLEAASEALLRRMEAKLEATDQLACSRRGIRSRRPMCSSCQQRPRCGPERE